MVTGDSQEEVIIFRDPQTAPIIYKSLSSSSKCHESKAMSKASHWILQSVAKAVVGAIRTNCKWLCIKKNGGHLFQTIIWICSEK